MAFHGNGANINITTDVSAGTYGDGNNIPTITIDANGRLDSIGTASVTYSTLNAGATVGSVGSYAFMQQASGDTQYAPGATLAGSSLRYSDATGRKHGDTPSGNWRCMGYDSGAALTNNGTVGGSAALADGSLQGGTVQGDVTGNIQGNPTNDLSLSGGNVQGNKTVNVSGNIQGGKGGSFNVTSGTIDTDELAVAGNVATDDLTITGTTGTIETDELTVAGNVSVNVNLGSITVQTEVAYSSTLWLRYS